MLEIDRHLGLRIEEARQLRGLSQAELADVIEADVATIAAMETGQVRIASIVLARIARELDLPLSWFFDGLPGQDVFDAPQRQRRLV
ncbi:MAG: helix-turn-helix transcriptional regulator [Pseudomonadota bacterium]|nr:helix-turn-helix transcriptional regulator [Pseudomonadota bacterium]